MGAFSQSGLWTWREPVAGSRMGSMDPSQPPTLERLRQLAPELLALTAAHGGQDLRVFGSVIHGAAGRQSDVDPLVDFP